MTNCVLSLDDLYKLHHFHPNDSQRKAINTLSGPLFLIAGPGSGKTRVLLWRTINAIVFHHVAPEKIFLSTFTEKAAKQLKDGLQAILGTVTNETGITYDISMMYVGTVHSLCQRLISDRRFGKQRERIAPPTLLDELSQYFFVNSSKFWNTVSELLNVNESEWRDELKIYFSKRSGSRHEAAITLMSIFNRFSEENLSIDTIMENAGSDEVLNQIAYVYDYYKKSLKEKNLVDFSLIQQRAYHYLIEDKQSMNVFEYVIVDEYQDTNRIQEQLFFQLALGHKNFCVVGDDDQALYRFRGATVENFVQFPDRCMQYLEITPQRIKLNINYRSKRRIVHTYTQFIEKTNWEREDGAGFYRLHEKKIQSYQKDNDISVMTTSPSKSQEVSNEIAFFVKKLIDEKKVKDANQIAFLFPALKNNKHVGRMKKALESVGLRVYAPRAGKFLDMTEPKETFGILSLIFGIPERQEYSGSYADYYNWLEAAKELGSMLVEEDDNLNRFVNSKRAELQKSREDYLLLSQSLEKNEWSVNDNYDPNVHKQILLRTPQLSRQAIRGFGTRRLDNIATSRLKNGNPFTLSYMLNRATSLDWNLLDLFYRISGFEHFSHMIKLAENGDDEGPVINLSMISKYLSRYMDQSQSMITGARLVENRLRNDFFGRYIYGLYRLGESEVENEEVPFPKGRIPFLTIHQSKGLEFPYVVIGNLGKRNRGVSKIEEIMRNVLSRDGEPLEKIHEFDTMRMFYVALSRAQDGLIITNLRGPGQRIEPAFKQLLSEENYPKITEVNVTKLSNVDMKESETPKIYSYTSDYLLYLNCPRKYMVFKKYGFVPSRSQTMVFGTLIHRTIEDIHNLILSMRGSNEQ